MTRFFEWLAWVIGDAVLKEHARRALIDAEEARQKLADDAKHRIAQRNEAEYPIWVFSRSLPSEDKPHCRFAWDKGRWKMTEAEKIRVVKLFSAAGYPGMSQ